MTTHLIRIFSTALTISSASLAACSSDSGNSANPTPDAGNGGDAAPSADSATDGSGSTATLSDLHTLTTVSSTVDPINGDKNPYALTFAPANFTGDGVPNHVQPGDLVVSNFSDNTGANFRGTTFEALRDGKPVRVFSETNAPTAAGGTVSSSGPVALAFAPNGNLWIANFGAKGDGTDGNVQIVTPGGKVAKTFTDPLVAGGWGQEFNHGAGGHAAFFTVNIVTGAVVRINIIVADAGPPSFTLDALTGDLGHSATSAGGTPIGAGGLVHDAKTDTLYVANGSTNAIVAISNASVTTTVSSGVDVFKGTPLHQPALMTRNPVNGDLIVANQLDNNLVEISTAGAMVAVRAANPAMVSATGANSALFGVAATKDAAGNLVVYFVDDTDDTVKKLTR